MKIILIALFCFTSLTGFAADDSFVTVRDGKTYTCVADNSIIGPRSCSIPSENKVMPGPGYSERYFNGCSVKCSSGQVAACTEGRYDCKFSGSSSSCYIIEAECECI